MISLHNTINKFFHANKESIYFYTFHKSASSLFSNIVLQGFENLTHVDYASMVWVDSNFTSFEFKSHGFVYGPCRIARKSAMSSFEKLDNIVCDENNIKNKKSIFMLRDPRDLLVSAYYSTAFSHIISPDPKIQQLQENVRNKNQAININEYVINEVDEVIHNFDKMINLIKKCNNNIVIKYEDMVLNYEVFKNKLQSFAKINTNTLRELYNESRPNLIVDKSVHKRSGTVGDYKTQLTELTRLELSRKLKPFLEYFNYIV